MARIRSIKPEFWQDEGVARLSRDARLLYIALWSEADDEGRFRAVPAYLKGRVFPYDDDLAMADFVAIVDELVTTAKVLLYTNDGERFGLVTSFAKHQKIDHKAKSRIPSPDDPGSTPFASPREPSRNPREGFRKSRELLRRSREPKRDHRE